MGRAGFDRFKSLVEAVEHQYLGKIKDLESELDDARRDIISLMPEKLQDVLRSYFRCESREERGRWDFIVARQIIDEAELLPRVQWYNGDRAYCPLCKAGSSSPYDEGFTVPEGLDRHLNGRGAYPCIVMSAATRLARRYWHEKFSAADAAEQAAAEERIKERRKSETLYRTAPGKSPELLDERLGYDRTPRTPDQLAWAEQRLEQLGFAATTEGNVKSYVREHNGVTVFADHRANGEITFRVFKKLLPGQRVTPKNSRELKSFTLKDSWKRDLGSNTSPGFRMDL